MSAKKLTAAAATALAAATSLAVPAHANVYAEDVPGAEREADGFDRRTTCCTSPADPGGGGTETMPSQKVVDAEWAPDGSRVAYVDENGSLIIGPVRRHRRR